MLLAALSLESSWAHLLELGPRLKWPSDLWISSTVVGNLYAEFGRAGAVVDMAALAALLALSITGRARPEAKFVWLAFGLFVLGFVTWLAGVLPMNQILATWHGSWLPGEVPRDFARVTRQWEFSHAAIAVLKIAGFLALGMAYVAPVPNTTARP